MMFSSKTPDQRYQQFNLSADQVARVDEFVWKLVNGQAAEPADFYSLRQENEKLRAQMDALNEKGFGVLKGHLEVLFKDMATGAGGGLSPEQFAKISGDNDELKARLEQLGQQLVGAAAGAAGSVGLPSGRVDGLGGTFSKSAAPQWSGRLQPPVPRVNPDSTVTHGYSNRFAADLLVTGKHGEDKAMDAKDHYDNAFLQVQLQECFELIKRKDEALKSQKQEIDALYSRIKKYLLM